MLYVPFYFLEILCNEIRNPQYFDYLRHFPQYFDMSPQFV